MIAMVIQKGRERLLILDGVEPNMIYLPLDTKQLTFLTHQSFVFQCALVDFMGQISIHFPGHKIIQSLHSLPLLPTAQLAITPIAEALTVFTDGSGKTGRAVTVWRDSEENWKSDIHIVTGSPQIVELSAVVRVFKLWTTPINIITDSAHMTGLVSRLEHAFLKEISNRILFALLWELKWLLDRRTHPYFIQHIRSHTSLPGPMSEGNIQADRLAGITVLPDCFAQARLSHEFYNQNAKALQRTFQLTQDQARQIIQSCPNCQQVLPAPTIGTNPRGLSSLEIWQTDVAHVPEFGKYKYVHVSIDTFSSCIYASVHSGEKAKDVCRHFIAAFSSLGVPKTIKTDNGPGYTVHKTQTFFQQCRIQHTTGIPHSPTGQAIIERAHSTLKIMLQKQKRGSLGLTPQEHIAKACYVLIFLNRWMEDRPPIQCHFGGSKDLRQEKAHVKV